MADESITVTFTGFTSRKQAETFVEWYSGQGEQDADPWFYEVMGEPAPNVSDKLKWPLDPDKIEVPLN